jgi:hypothetical protein
MLLICCGAVYAVVIRNRWSKDTSVDSEVRCFAGVSCPAGTPVGENPAGLKVVPCVAAPTVAKYLGVSGVG